MRYVLCLPTKQFSLLQFVEAGESGGGGPKVLARRTRFREQISDWNSAETRKTVDRVD